MFNHEPPDCSCPFCFLLSGASTELDSPSDILLQTPLATALVASRWYPNNPGHVLVIPNAHHENLHDLPPPYGHAVHDVVRAVAIAMRSAGSFGTSVRQRNEPDGGQEVWHHHVHVFPRYPGDRFQTSVPSHVSAPVEERKAYVDKLRQFLPS